MSNVNKEAARQIVNEIINKGRLELIDELVSSDYVYHEPTVGERRTSALSRQPPRRATVRKRQGRTNASRSGVIVLA
jgi:hypothetical protein